MRVARTAVACALALAATATATAAPGASAPQGVPTVALPEEPATTVVALDRLTPFTSAGDAVARLGTFVRAAFHDGANRGSMRSAPDTGPAFFARYAEHLRSEPARPRIVGVLLDGSFSTEQLEGAGLRVRESVVVPSHVAANVYGPAASDPIVLVGAAGSVQGDSTASAASAPSGEWLPAVGKVDAYAGDNRRVIRQEMTWTSPDGIASFGDAWAYEHDFKLFADDQGVVMGRRPFCAGPGADDFWADRDALSDEVLETNLPAGSSPYLDTQSQDDCAVQDYTVGIFNPSLLAAGEKYWTSITTGGGDDDSTPAQLSASVMPKNCPVDSPWCVDLVPFDDREGESTLLVGRERYSVPGCREWQPGRDSRDCAFFDDFNRSDRQLNGDNGWEGNSTLDLGFLSIRGGAVTATTDENFPQDSVFQHGPASVAERTMAARDGVMDIEVTASNPTTVNSQAGLVIGANGKYTQGLSVFAHSWGFAQIQYARPDPFNPGAYDTDLLYDFVSTPTWEPGSTTVRLSYDGNTGDVRFYVDGQLYAEYLLPTGLPTERVALVATDQTQEWAIDFDDFRQH